MKKSMAFLAAVMAATFLFVGAAGAEMYLEGYIGPTWSSDIGQAFSVHDVIIDPTHKADYFHQLHYGGRTDVTVLGGAKLGTWFVPEGFAGWSGYPSWAKYFGFYTDFGYQRLYMRSQRLSGTETNVNTTSGFNYALGSAEQFTEVGSISANGMVATWAFMFAARYGFFPDSEVPFGRLQPYVAVGPALMFSSMKPQLQTQTRDHGGGTNLGFSGNTSSSTDIALAVDAGVRYMALKNVSLDLSFKYRYAQPRYHINGIDWGADYPQPASFTINPVYQLFSFQAGVAYHF